MSELIEIEEVNGFGAPPPDLDDRILHLYHYWDAKRDGRDMPDRRDLDPLTEVPRLLSAVWLLDVEHDPVRLRYRLIGSDLTHAGAPSRVGLYVEDQPQSPDGHQTLAAFKACCTDGKVYWRRGRPQLSHLQHINCVQNLALPLTVDQSDRVMMLMMMTIYDWQKVSQPARAR